MKHLSAFLLALTISIVAAAQVPQGFNYQAVIRNAEGDIMVNQNANIKFTIRTTLSGITLIKYQEAQPLVTNEFGLINCVIGNGTVLQGSMTSVDWDSGNRYLRVEGDMGNGFVDMGTQQMMSVPYALHAEQADNATEAWSKTGNAATIDTTSFIGTTDNVPFNIRVNNQKAGRIDHLLHNTFYGYLSGNANSTGNSNTAHGTNALCTNVGGSNGTAIGFNAMRYVYNTAASYTNYSVAVGYEALRGSTTAANNTGNYNTALGYQSLWGNNFGADNTAAGYHALYSNTIGISNTAIGRDALTSNIDGDYNTASGMGALADNISGVFNTACGHQALASNLGSRNTASGTNALYTNVGGSNGTAIGYNAMRYANSTTATYTNYSVAVGYEALRGSTTAANNTGNYNTALGYQSLRGNNFGADNTAAGYHALYSNTIGISNTAIGRDALTSNIDGDYNTASGMGALADNISGVFNTANGHQALTSNNVGNRNTASGTNALYTNVGGSNGTAIGYNAMRYANSTNASYTNYSVAVGFEALRGLTNAANNTGNYNTALGYQSLTVNSTGNNNTGCGYIALSDNTIGTSNTAFGYAALYNNTTGTNNTAVGRSAYFDVLTLDNTTCLGRAAGGVVDASNRVEIGNTSVSVIAGQVGWSTYSDARIKDNVQDDVPGLDFIAKLRPVTYNLNIHRENEMVHADKEKYEGDWQGKYDIEKIKMTGFLAQEVEQAAKELGYDFSGVQIPDNANDLYSIRYSDFVMPLVKGMQEQQQMIEELMVENTGLKNAGSAMKIETTELEKSIEELKVLLAQQQSQINALIAVSK